MQTAHPRHPVPHVRHRRLARALACLLALALPLTALAKDKPIEESSAWKRLDELIEREEFKSAAALARGLGEQARLSGDEALWARALIREVSLLVSSQGYERAVTRLLDIDPPQSSIWRAAIALTRANALMRYRSAYSRDIARRERVISEGPKPIEIWTRDEINAAINDAFAEAWALRVALAVVPFQDLALVIERNDYPEAIRPSPRDALTYLWIDALADQANWRPAEVANTFALDMDDLLSPDPALFEPEILTGEAIHPLLKVGVLTAELAKWHLSRGEREAALEALRVRMEALTPALNAAQRDQVLDDFDQKISAFSEEPWSAMALASLARQLMTRDQPGDRVRALALAQRGLDRFPDTAGGAHCKVVVQDITARSFSLSVKAVDGPRQRSIEVRHINFEGKLFLRAAPVAFEDMIAGKMPFEEPFKRQSRDEWHAQLVTLIRDNTVADWSVQLANPGDFHAHTTFIAPPLDKPGTYVIAATDKEAFDGRNAHWWQDDIQVHAFVVSNLAIVEDKQEAAHIARVLDARTGAPIADAEVEVYQREHGEEGLSDFRKTATLRTDLSGEVRLELESPRKGLHPLGEYLLRARKGEDETHTLRPQSLNSVPSLRSPLKGLVRFMTDQGPMTLEEQNARRHRPVDKALIYTDRSVYRPGQTVHWKVVPYRHEAAKARFSTLRGADIEVALVDANGRRVTIKKAKCDTFGAAHGAFELPTDRALGAWHLRVSRVDTKKRDGWLGTQLIRVEEYKRPTFEVAIDEALGKAARINQPVSVSGTARTFYGSQINAGEARWSVVRSAMPFRTPFFQLPCSRSRPPPRHPPEIIASGTAALDAEGRFRFEFTPRADPAEEKTWPDQRYRFTVKVEVTDLGGETREASRNIALGFRTIDAELRMPAGFVDAGKAFEISALRTAIDGTPRPGPGRFWVTRLSLPASAPSPADLPRPQDSGRDTRFDLPGDAMRSRADSDYSQEQALALQPEGERVADGQVRHDARGIGDIPLPRLDPGAYRLHYATEDDKGRPIERQSDFIVASPAPVLGLPAVLLADKSTARPGEKLRLFVHSGRPNQRLLLEVFRAGQRVSHRWIVAGKDTALREIAITEADRGGFTVRLSGVMDWQSVSLSVDIEVPFDDRALDIAWERFRDRVEPGKKERIRLKIRRRDGQRLNARDIELFAYAYDRSLEAFAEHRPVHPLDFLPNRRGAPRPVSILSDTLQLTHHGHVRDARYPSKRFPGMPEFRPDRLFSLSRHGVYWPGLGRGRGALGNRRAMDMNAYAAVTIAASTDGSPPKIMGAMASPEQQERSRQNRVLEEVERADAPDPGNAWARADFRETAFWIPSVRMNRDGSATIEFTVPDALTSWRVWTVALTRQLNAGIADRTFESARELMARPRLPRFVREGDRAALAVTVDSAAAKTLTGEVSIALTDPVSGRSLNERYGLSADAAKAAFTLKAGKSQTFSFPIQVPPGVGDIEVRATARTSDGRLADSELRPLPVLPSRTHLSQSRFAALRGNERRTLSFDVNAGDSSLVSEALVVTVDANLIDGALAALPSLTRTPYASVEAIMSRLVATSVMAGLAGDFPSLGKRAQKLASQRTTRLLPFDEDDPNRRIALEETPWLSAARGGATGDDVLSILDPEVARAERDNAERRLREAQHHSGGFAWWPGGRPSVHMTLQVLAGFARMAEFGADFPRDIAHRAWRFLGEWHEREIDVWLSQPKDKEASKVALATFFNFVASAFDGQRDAEVLPSRDKRQKLLDFSFRHRRELSPMSRGQLALTLKRMGRVEDAKLVFASVMDAARTTADEGTFWQPEAQSWLWYRDTVESHAFALRVLSELDPKDPRRDGLVQWLLLNRKLNQWKSTRASAEAIYAIAHHARAQGRLDEVERVRVTLGNERHDLAFDPTRPGASKKRQIALEPAAIDAKSLRGIALEQKTPGLMFASATWHFSTEDAAIDSSGDLFSVRRAYFRRVIRGGEWALEPLDEGAKLNVGDEVEVRLTIAARHGAEYVHLRDPRAAGLEPVNARSGPRFDHALAYRQEVRDSAMNLFFDRLPTGEFTFRYRLKATMAGEFRASPATLQSVYAPEFTAHSSGTRLTIAP